MPIFPGIPVGLSGPHTSEPDELAVFEDDAGKKLKGSGVKVADLATAAQGTKADTAIQPEDLGSAAFEPASAFASAAQGAKADSAVQPAQLGSAAGHAASDFATAAQGTKADSAVQPGALGALATKSAIAVTDITATGTRDATTVLHGDGSWAAPAGGGGGSSAVSSVNTQTGDVVLNADHIADTSTAHKFATAAEKAKLANITVTQAVDLDAIKTRVNALDAAIILMGTWSAASGSFPGGGTAQAGESWIVSADGTINSVAFNAGDRLIAITDNASTTTFANNWFKADYTDAVQTVDGQVGTPTIGGILAAAASKATPVDTDKLAISDSAASNGTKHVTFANLKAWLWAAWGGLVAGGTAKATPVDADSLALSDSAASNSTKKLTWAALKVTLKTYFDTLYQPASTKLVNIAGLTPTTGDTIIWNGTAYVSQAPGGGTVIASKQEGFVNTTSISTTGSAGAQDFKYIDIVVAAVNIAKAVPTFEGTIGYANIAGSGTAVGGYICTYGPTNGAIGVVTARMLNSTTLRLSFSDRAGILTNPTSITGQWRIVEYT